MEAPLAAEAAARSVPSWSEWTSGSARVTTAQP
jgi:hypothetical protein